MHTWVLRATERRIASEWKTARLEETKARAVAACASEANQAPEAVAALQDFKIM